MYDGGASGPIIYAYVSSNPLSFIDPLGLAKCDETTRVRHYTNRKGSNAIEESGVIQAEDQYRIKPGRGRDYIETDVESSRLEWVKNPSYGREELTVKGDVTLQNANIVRRR